MGWFNVIKKAVNAEAREMNLSAPITGEYIPMEEINDEVFSQGILGEGCGIIPAEGNVYAPVDGEISMIADTKHAIGISTDRGLEFMIHVGMDTVEMNGTGFEVKVSNGQKIERGELLLCFDMEKIKAAGYPTDTAFVVVEKGEFSELNLSVNRSYNKKEVIGKLRRG